MTNTDKTILWTILTIILAFLLTILIVVIPKETGYIVLTPPPIESVEPTVIPTIIPTSIPTSIPTVAPTPVPTVIPSVEPTPIPTIEPVVSVEIDASELPPMANKGFDLSKDLTYALPLRVDSDNVIALKLEQIEGWTWRLAEPQNVALMMVHNEYFIVRCIIPNMETFVTFEMFNGDGNVGMTLYVEFAVAIGNK